MSLSNAARPGFSLAVFPHSKAAPAWRGSRLAPACASISPPPPCSTAGGKNAANPGASRGPPPTPAPPRGAVPDPRPAHAQRVGESFADRGGRLPGCRHLFEHGKIGDVEGFHHAPPEPELDGSLIDCGVAERDRNIGGKTRERRDDFLGHRIEFPGEP